MANEWTAIDVLRVMREEAESDGTVYLPKVKARFNLNGKIKELHFDSCVEVLISACRYEALGQMRGRLIAHIPQPKPVGPLENIGSVFPNRGRPLDEILGADENVGSEPSPAKEYAPAYLAITFHRLEGKHVACIWDGVPVIAGNKVTAKIEDLVETDDKEALLKLLDEILAARIS